MKKPQAANTVASPCIRNCCLDENDVCIGCFRTIAEIMQWSGSDEANKRNILAKAKARAAVKSHKFS